MTAPQTLVHYIKHWATTEPDWPATHAQRAGVWETKTWRQYWDAVTELGRGLMALGQQPSQGVAIVGGNRPEWVESQFAAQAIGAWSVPLYPTSTLVQMGGIIRDAGVRIVVCDGQAQLDRLLAGEKEGHLARLSQLVVFDPVDTNDPRVISYEQLRTMGREAPMVEFDARLAQLSPKDTCQLIYTSGTTGDPKGVRLNNRGQLATIEAVMERFPTFRERRNRVVSYLPLSHQAEQLVTNVGAIRTGGEAFFCPEISQVKDYLLKARPTVFLAVPRVWEKFEAALRARFGEQKGLANWLMKKALVVEGAGFEKDCSDGRYHDSFARSLLRKLVINKVREGLGLDQLQVALTGSAPIGTETQRFFGGLGIVIHEAYGLTENGGLVTTSVFRKPKLGSVGTPIAGFEVRLAEDGEILVRGASNTAGYYNRADATKELYTEDGFLRTGDLGKLAEDGSLSITGRKKEVLITAGGKNVGPVEIESLINRISGVGQSVVVGDRKPYLTALITLDPEQRSMLAGVAGLTNGGQTPTLADLAAHPAVQTYVQGQVDTQCNAQLARYQTIKKVTLLPAEFSVETGEVTPSMKLRRAQIVEKYASEVAAMYGEAPQSSEAASVSA